MELNYNSKLAMFYRWYYKTEKMPNSLCPYFWKLILPFITGIFILRLLAELTKKMHSEWEWSFMDIIAVHMWGVMVVLGIGTVAGMIVLPFTYGNESFYILHIMGVLGYLIVAAGIITLLVKYIIEKRQRRTLVVYKKKEPNVLYEGIKAIFKKYCPIIKWENNETRENTETMD